MADVSVDILERIALGIIAVVSGIGAWGFRFLNGKIDKIESNIDDDILRLHKRLDDSEKNILSAIAVDGDRRVPRTHCDAKQELWVVKTDADRDANTKEHTSLVVTIVELKDIIKLIGESQVVSSKQVADELREVQECVKKLTRGLECD